MTVSYLLSLLFIFVDPTTCFPPEICGLHFTKYIFLFFLHLLFRFSVFIQISHSAFYSRSYPQYFLSSVNHLRIFCLFFLFVSLYVLLISTALSQLINYHYLFQTYYVLQCLFVCLDCCRYFIFISYVYNFLVIHDFERNIHSKHQEQSLVPIITISSRRKKNG